MSLSKVKGRSIRIKFDDRATFQLSKAQKLYYATVCTVQFRVRYKYYSTNTHFFNDHWHSLCKEKDLEDIWCIFEGEAADSHGVVDSYLSQESKLMNHMRWSVWWCNSTQIIIMLLCWDMESSSLIHRHAGAGGAMCTHVIIYGIVTLMSCVYMRSFLESLLEKIHCSSSILKLT